MPDIAGMLGGAGPILMMVLVLVVFYFILIRPQKKKEKQLQDMLSKLNVGDEVASIGGIHGKIVRKKETVFVLETGIGTTKSYITIERAAISKLLKKGDEPDEDDDVDVAPLPEADDLSTDSAKEND